MRLFDQALVGASFYVTGIFVGRSTISGEIDGTVTRVKASPDATLYQLLESGVPCDGSELDLRLLCRGQAWFEDAEIEIRLDRDGSLDDVRFADEGVGRRGGELLSCIEFVAQQWRMDPNLPARKLVLCAEPGLCGRKIDRPEMGLHECFSLIAAGQPEAIAIREGVETMTYGELDAKTDQLALKLMDAGVQPGDVVATFFPRGMEFCVSVIGILKAGAAYLPIDPNYPAERHVGMLEDGGCELVLVKDLHGGLLEGVREMVVDLEQLEAIAEPAARVPRVGTDAAYVIFTSGSTGRPKGVVNTHRGALNEVLCCGELWHLHAEDRVPEFASISFDVAVEEIWVTWLAGAELIVTPKEVVRSHADFLNWVEEERVTVLDLPTAFWHSIVAAVENGDARVPSSLRLVVVGGEFARSSAYRRWKELTGPSVKWANAYGPTEAAIGCTFFCDWRERNFGEDVPIGRPVTNSVAYVVDADGRGLPPGFIGELWMGGDCLAEGYLGLPEMTAQRFLADPFSSADGQRVYKTGDHVWVDEDGRLHFIGRLDRQVKVRGFRIELDEVEDALNSVPGIADAAVKVIESAGGLELVAYISPEMDAGVVIEELFKRLPAPMHPSRFVGMEQLPKTNNGKIDYKALPCVFKTNAAMKIEVPADPIVEIMLEEMRESVSVPSLGASDNFFSVGGHSLRMMELIAALARRGLVISTDDFLREPTATGLAEAVRRRRQRVIKPEDWSPLRPLRKVEGAPVLIFPHSTPGDVMGYGNLVNQLGSDVSCYGLVARGTLVNLEPHTDLKEMASYYVDAIVRELEGPYHLCGWCFGGMLAFEIAQQLRARGKEVRRLILIDTEVPPMPGLAWFRSLGKLRALWRFPKRKLVRYFWDKVPKLGGRVPVADPHARDTDVYRLNAAAYDRYQGERYPGHIDEITSGVSLWDGLPVQFSDDKRARAAVSAERHFVDGDHMTLMRDPVVAQVAARIRSLLEVDK